MSTAAVHGGSGSHYITAQAPFTVLLCSFSSYSAFRAQKLKPLLACTRSFRGLEINVSDIRINMGKEGKEGSEDEFWPEMKCPEREGARWMLASASVPLTLHSQPPPQLLPQKQDTFGCKPTTVGGLP